MTQAVLTTIESGIATITLNRPEARNALDQAMRDELAEAVARVRDDASVKCVILTGAGNAFCSGGDIKSMLASGEGKTLEWREGIRKLHRWFPELVNLEKPVIAAVDGPAFGAGFGLALAADFILATKRATFCAVFGRIGLVPDLGVMYLLPRIVGRQKAKELVFTTRVVGAEEARDLSLVYDVVEDGGALQAAARKLASELGESSTSAIGLAKTIMNQAFELDAHAMAEMEAGAQAICRGSAYHQEAIQRFRDKKPLRFSGKF